MLVMKKKLVIKIRVQAQSDGSERESDIEMFNDNSDTAGSDTLSRSDQLLTILSLLEGLPAPGFNITSGPNSTQKVQHRHAQ